MNLLNTLFRRKNKIAYQELIKKIQEKTKKKTEEFIEEMIKTNEEWIFGNHNIETTKNWIKNNYGIKLTQEEAKIFYQLLAKKAREMKDEKTSIPRRKFLKIAARTLGAAAIATTIPIALNNNIKKVSLSELNLPLQANIIVKRYEKDFEKILLENINILQKQLKENAQVTPKQIKEQTGYSIYNLSTKLLPGGTAKSEKEKGQILFLPYRGRRNYSFVIFPIHILKKEIDTAIKNNSLVESDIKIQNESTGSITILSYSKELDLIFGFAPLTKELELKPISLYKKQLVGKQVIVIPSYHSIKEDYNNIDGIITDANKNFILTNHQLKKGYSGSPYFVKGQLAGIATHGSTDPKYSYTFGPNSKSIMNLVEECIKTYSSKE